MSSEPEAVPEARKKRTIGDIVGLAWGIFLGLWVLSGLILGLVALIAIWVDPPKPPNHSVETPATPTSSGYEDCVRYADMGSPAEQVAQQAYCADTWTDPGPLP